MPIAVLLPSTTIDLVPLCFTCNCAFIIIFLYYVLAFTYIIISCCAWNCFAQTKYCFDGNVHVSVRKPGEIKVLVINNTKSSAFQLVKVEVVERPNIFIVRIGSSRSFFPCSRPEIQSWINLMQYLFIIFNSIQCELFPKGK